MDLKLDEETTCQEKEFKLPDNTKIKIGKERFMGPEILFSPHLLGKEEAGCAEMVFNSIQVISFFIPKEITIRCKSWIL